MFKDFLYNLFYKNVESLRKMDSAMGGPLEVPKEKPIEKDANIFDDLLMPGLGNLYAYNEHLKRKSQSGIHLMFDINGLGAINDKFSLRHGDGVVKTLFKIVKKYTDDEGFEVFRIAGDLGYVYIPSAKKAVLFANSLIKKMETFPKMDYHHSVSISIGIGYTPEQAKKALFISKSKLHENIDNKKHPKFAPGMEPNVVTSLLDEAPPQYWRPDIQDREPPQGIKLANPLK